MNNAKIDVILPTYNQSEFLHSAIACMLNQNFQDFRLIIINDGSTDATEKILDTFYSSNPKITIVHQSNKGLPASLNIGHSIGNSPYCTWISTDNLSLPDYLKELYEYITINDLDFVQSNFWKIKEGEFKKVSNPTLNTGPLKVGNLGASFLYKREVWEKIKYDEYNHGVEDLKFFLNIKYKSDFKTGHVNIALVYYYYQSNSISVRQESIVKENLKTLREMFKKRLGLNESGSVQEINKKEKYIKKY